MTHESEVLQSGAGPLDMSGVYAYALRVRNGEVAGGVDALVDAVVMISERGSVEALAHCEAALEVALRHASAAEAGAFAARAGALARARASGARAAAPLVVLACARRAARGLCFDALALVAAYDALCADSHGPTRFRALRIYPELAPLIAGLPGAYGLGTRSDGVARAAVLLIWLHRRCKGPLGKATALCAAASAWIGLHGSEGGSPGASSNPGGTAPTIREAWPVLMTLAKEAKRCAEGEEALALAIPYWFRAFVQIVGGSGAHSATEGAGGTGSGAGNAENAPITIGGTDQTRKVLSNLVSEFWGRFGEPLVTAGTVPASFLAFCPTRAQRRCWRALLVRHDGLVADGNWAEGVALLARVACWLSDVRIPVLGGEKRTPAPVPPPTNYATSPIPTVLFGPPPAWEHFQLDLKLAHVLPVPAAQAHELRGELVARLGPHLREAEADPRALQALLCALPGPEVCIALMEGVTAARQAAEGRVLAPAPFAAKFVGDAGAEDAALAFLTCLYASGSIVGLWAHVSPLLRLLAQTLRQLQLTRTLRLAFSLGAYVGGHAGGTDAEIDINDSELYTIPALELSAKDRVLLEGDPTIRLDIERTVFRLAAPTLVHAWTPIRRTGTASLLRWAPSLAPFTPLLARLVRDPDPDVRARAEAAQARLNGTPTPCALPQLLHNISI